MRWKDFVKAEKARWRLMFTKVPIQERGSLERLAHQLDVFWGIFSMVLVTFLLSAVIALLLQQPGITAVNAPNYQLPVFVIDSDSSAIIQSPVVLSTDKATYYAHLTDMSGKIVFDYPPAKKDSKGKLAFLIPHIFAGSYYLTADIKYQINAIKNATLHIKLAKIIISY